MGIRFNADEVLSVAERIEENGAAFYRRAAELRPRTEESAAARLRGLAEMEDRHRQTFAAMRRELKPEMREQTAADPYLEAVLYLQEMADTHGGEGAPDLAAALTGRESMAEILRTAIGLEQKSILFYLGLKEMVPRKLGGDRIEAILAEERSHVVSLTEELRKLKAR